MMKCDGFFMALILLGILLSTSVIFVQHSYACTYSCIPYQGNDDGEFDYQTTHPAYVYLSEGLTKTMSWTSGSGWVTMQYDPDVDTSLLIQANGDWFQTLERSNGNGCMQDRVQVWNIPNDNIVWQTTYPSSGCDGNTYGIFSNRAGWEIEEIQICGRTCYIDQVYYSQFGGGRNGEGFSYTQAIPTSSPGPWWWVRSQLCWCGGALGDSTDFTSAGGTSAALSNVGLVTIGPPTDGVEAENSNMQYTCMRGSGTTQISQSFGLSGRC